MTTDDTGVDAWIAETTAFDRVQSVATSRDEPASAATVADEAHVAENTARDHLERLVEMNVVLADERGGTTVYGPDPLHTRVQSLRELLDAHDHDGLVALAAELREQIETWREAYEATTPTELRERAATADDAATTREIREVAAEWELLAHRLSLVEDAVGNYDSYTRDTPTPA